MPSSSSAFELSNLSWIIGIRCAKEMFLSGSIAVVRDDSSAFGDHLFKSVGRTKDRQVMLGCLERAVKPHKRIVIHRDSKFIVQTRLLEFVRVIAPIFRFGRMLGLVDSTMYTVNC